MAPIVSVARATQVEDGNITFTIRLSEPGDDIVSVDYRLYDGTADVGLDVRTASSSVPIAGRLEFGIGQTERTLTFYVADGVAIDEHFALRLFNTDGASLGAGNHSIETTGWILDSDAGLNRALAVSAPAVVEGATSTAEFTISLSRAFDTNTTFSFSTADGSARAGVDHVARTGTVTFAAGQTEATVAVTLLNDTAAEAGETFHLNVAGAGGVTGASGEAKILNDDGALPTISLEQATQIEDGNITFTLRLSEPADDIVSVDYRLYDGTADVGTDVRAASSSVPTVDRLEFGIGQTVRTLTFYVADGVAIDEHFALRLFNTDGASLGAGNHSIETTGWILDRDTGLNRAVAVSAPAVVEGATSTADFTISLSRAFDTNTTFSFSTADGSALAGVDYVARTGTVTFAAGQTEATVAVTLLNDTVAEAGETFHLNVAGTDGVAGASGDAKILNDDGALPIISLESARQLEDGNITFTVRLSEPANDIVSVDYSLLDGTADVGTDVRAASSSVPTTGRLEFGIGQTVRTLTFYVDDTVALDEHFALRLSSPEGGAFGGSNRTLETTGWILDNDAGLNRAIAISSPLVVEQPGAAAVFEVSLSAPSDTPLTFNFRTVAGSATNADFVARTGTVTFAAGQTTAEVVIALRTDAAVELLENFRLELVPPFGSAISSDAIVSPGIATIIDYARVGTAGNNVLVGTASAERIDGLAGNDTILGRAGDDGLIGGAGNDVLNGEGGNDLMQGGAGSDAYVVDSSLDRVVEGAGAANGNDHVSASASFTLGNNVERLTLVGAANIAGTGNALANILAGNGAANRLAGLDGNDTLSGNGGNDALLGGNGADLLDGGLGADTMTGGAGNDRYVVDGVGDLVVEAAGAAGGIDLVTTLVSLTLGANVENLTLGGSGAIAGRGNALANVIGGNAAGNVIAGFDGNDVLRGNGGDDTVDGGEGNDTMDGGLGTDTMTGGLGNDLYVVNAATDRTVETRGLAGGLDQVNASVSVVLGLSIERLALLGTAALGGTGNTSANTMSGNVAGNALSGLAGDDSLVGFGGGDRLDGGADDDTLVGGVGSDSLLFGSGDDVVTAFEDNVDTLLFDDALLGGAPRTPAGALSFATLQGTEAVFAFAGGHTLTVEGVTSLSQLGNDIGFF